MSSGIGQPKSLSFASSSEHGRYRFYAFTCVQCLFSANHNQTSSCQVTTIIQANWNEEALTIFHEEENLKRFGKNKTRHQVIQNEPRATTSPAQSNAEDECLAYNESSVWSNYLLRRLSIAAVQVLPMRCVVASSKFNSIRKVPPIDHCCCVLNEKAEPDVLPSERRSHWMHWLQ